MKIKDNSMSRIEESKKVVRYDTTETGIVCDKCEKEYKYKETGIYREHKNEKKFYEVTIGHRDWGNDSCDSIEYLDFCCYDCLQNFLKNILKTMKAILHI
jgi:hypothetical protein